MERGQLKALHITAKNIGPTEKKDKCPKINLFLIRSMGYLILSHLVTANMDVSTAEAPPRVLNKTKWIWSNTVAGRRRGSGVDLARVMNIMIGKVMFVRKSDMDRRLKRREEARTGDLVLGSLNQNTRGLRMVEIINTKIHIIMKT